MRAFLFIAMIGCASGPNPHDTSMAGHDQAAREHDAAATNLEADCGRQITSGPCWKHRDTTAIAEHREAALRHRAATAALEAAENQACSGISDDDRAMSPLEHRDDIARVEPLVERVTASKAPWSHQVGATITLRAVRGLTGEWLQRLVDCHLARNAAFGHAVPEMPDCPLVPRDVTARVRSVGNGFAVDVRSDDTDSAREVLARAQRLVAHR